MSLCLTKNVTPFHKKCHSFSKKMSLILLIKLHSLIILINFKTQFFNKTIINDFSNQSPSDSIHLFNLIGIF